MIQKTVFHVSGARRTLPRASGASLRAGSSRIYPVLASLKSAWLSLLAATCRNVQGTVKVSNEAQPFFIKHVCFCSEMLQRSVRSWCLCPGLHMACGRRRLKCCVWCILNPRCDPWHKFSAAFVDSGASWPFVFVSQASNRVALTLQSGV